MLTVAVVVHMAACTFFFVATLEPAGAGWTALAGVRDEPVAQQYLTSLYWATTTITTVGGHERQYGGACAAVRWGVRSSAVGHALQYLTSLCWATITTVGGHAPQYGGACAAVRWGMRCSTVGHAQYLTSLYWAHHNHHHGGGA